MGSVRVTNNDIARLDAIGVKIDKLKAVNAQLVAALEWYADKCSGMHGNDDMEALETDRGSKARAALAAAKESP